MLEKWKKVKEEKGYLISSWGRVFSLKRKRILRPYLHESRANVYWRIELNSNKYMLHVLVALNYKRKQYEELKKISTNPQVGHNDRNTLNANATNLNWETDLQNKEHRHRTDIINFGGKTYKGQLM